MKLGGETIAAGEYSMYTIPGESEGTIIINTAKSWGTKYDESKDVARFKAPATSTNDAVETFTIFMTDFDKKGKKKEEPKKKEEDDVSLILAHNHVMSSLHFKRWASTLLQ